MLSLARGISAPTAAAAVVAAGVRQAPRRGTVIVARKHELDRPYPELDGPPMREIEDYPDRVPIYSKLYETVELLAKNPAPEHQLLGVLLTRDVPGLGETGHTVLVHRSRYWHYLYPLGWARITSLRSQQQSQQSDWRSSRVFTGPLYRLQRTLEAMHLLVPVNHDAAKAAGAASHLSERHVSVAFRRYGVEIPRRAIRLPERPPALTGRGASSGTFKVGVQLNSAVTVSVKASVHHVTLGESGSGLPPARLPKVEVDDWLTEMYPAPVLPENVHVFENYLLQQGPPDFERLLGSNRSRIRKGV